MEIPASHRPPRSSSKRIQGVKLRDENKIELIPIKPELQPILPKPNWIRIKPHNSKEITRIKTILRQQKLATVCEEASCPNLPECFSGGTATFMIMGEICTRRCPFCDVAHGKPNALDPEEPYNLAVAIAEMQLRYVVITSVDRDDLHDGGATHFASCIDTIRQHNPNIRIEILTPDFRGRKKIAIDILSNTPPNVFNHNMETVPTLYRQVRPGANYQWSLKLLADYKTHNPNVLTKSGLMVGVGESKEELLHTLEDLREHHVDILTIGQYLQPSRSHLPVTRYVHPDEFVEYSDFAYSIGFKQVASAPLVRSSYHADKQVAALMDVVNNIANFK